MSLTGFSMKRSENDVAYFYRWLGYELGDHIHEWLDLYADRKGAEVHRVCIIAPRDHSKSTTLRVCLLHHMLFSKWRNKPFTCWLFSASKDTASNRLTEIREDLKRHPELRQYIDEKRGGKFELRLTNGSWIKATGMGAAMRGEHPACIALDDILTDMGDTPMDVVRDWLRKVVTPMLSPGTNLFCVGTPMSAVDLYHTEMLPNDAWKCGVWSAIPNWDEHRADPNVELQVLWPQQRSLAFIMEQRGAMGDLAFTQEYLCKVVDDDSAAYPRQHTRKNLDMESRLEFEKHHQGRYVIGFDPSHGLGQDYSVMVVMRQAADGNLHLVNIWRRNDFPPARQAEKLVELAKIYGNATVSAEVVGFQQLYQALINQMGATIDYQPSKVSNKGLKQGLLNRLRVWFEQEKMVFPYGEHHTRQAVNILLDELETHVWKGGDIVDLGKHNDCVMALAHAVDQFSVGASRQTPVITGKIQAGEWSGGKEKARGRPRNTRFVSFF
mgnify:FL=1|tara:strand:- start:2372 stop:3859 length:1488 start_codon:yes stop_codon:yes gene_type:complete